MKSLEEICEENKEQLKHEEEVLVVTDTTLLELLEREVCNEIEIHEDKVIFKIEKYFPLYAVTQFARLKMFSVMARRQYPYPITIESAVFGKRDYGGFVVILKLHECKY